jgi:hypothetical protein
MDAHVGSQMSKTNLATALTDDDFSKILGNMREVFLTIKTTFDQSSYLAGDIGIQISQSSRRPRPDGRDV